MLDDRLVGTWSDANLYMGSMEAADITFRPDGTGWIYWSRDGGSFYVHRFNWLSRSGSHVDLQLCDTLYGKMTVRGSEIHHHVESKSADDTVLAVNYKISSRYDVLRNQVTLLEFDRRLLIGTVGDRFALKSDTSAVDPTITAAP